MKTVLLGTLLSAGLAIAAMGALWDCGQVFAQRPTDPFQAAVANGELIALATTIGDKYQQVTVIDPKQRVMSVYHVELATGKISLRSVRNIHWDLQMTEFNGDNPLPQEIQSLLGAK